LTDYQILSEWTTQILTDPRMYAELPVDISWIPTKPLPDAKIVKDYELQRTEPIEGSLFGSSVTYVSTSMEETTRPVLTWRAGVSVNKNELNMAKEHGFDMLKNFLLPPLRTLNMQTAQLIFQGTTAARDKVAIDGMIDLGTDTDAGLDDDPWDTAAEPIEHVVAGVKDLIDQGYMPPYTMIMSADLLTGYHALHNAAGGLTEAMLAAGVGLNSTSIRYIDRAVFAAHGTDASHVVYPLPAATTDDGVWILCKVAPENFYLGIIEPLNTLPWEYNRANNSYDTIMQTRLTFVVRDGNSIVYEPDVDLVA
jgi:hypothetical protein